jgi:glycogen synthase
VRALIVTNHFPPVEHGGYELSCQAFVEHLSARDHDVRVLTTRPEKPVESDAGSPIYRDLVWYRQPDGSFASHGWLKRCLLERHNRATLLRAIREFAPDVVMWWNMGGLSLSLIEIARRARLPAVGVVCDYWMIWGPGVDPWLRAGRRARAMASLLEGLSRVPMRVEFGPAARWVFVSEHVLSETVDAVGELPRVEVVHTGIAARRFSEAPSDRAWSGSLLMVGRLTRNKGIDIALEALAGLPDCTLDIYGHAEAKERADAERRIAELGLDARVTLHAHVGQEEIERLYAQYDALLFPVRWDEPWGRAPLEAMASGVAVVAAARGGAREYLSDEDNCLVAFDADEVQRAVERLASDPGLRARIAQAARATALRHDISRANSGREQALHEAIAEADGR